MQEAVASSPKTINSAQAYATSWEHHSDELRRLDLLIRLCLLRARRGRPADPPSILLDQFRGLVLSDEEIARLLADADGAHVWRPQEQLHEELFIELEMPRPDAGDRKRLWESLLNGRYHFAADVDWGALASKFRFSPGQMRDALAAAENIARWRSPAGPQVTMADLHKACRSQSTPKLSALARKVEPKYTWDDLVLPDDELAQLHEICQQAKHRNIVYGEWGFGRKLSLGKGLNALFSGPPGTGKTMAAEVIANELQLDLYRIDLSQVVSKYIGETEKNLNQIFREAQTSNAILFSMESTRCSGNALRSKTRTTATPTSRSVTCCRRWKSTTGSRSWRPTCART